MSEQEGVRKDLVLVPGEFKEGSRLWAFVMHETLSRSKGNSIIGDFINLSCKTEGMILSLVNKQQADTGQPEKGTLVVFMVRTTSCFCLCSDIILKTTSVCPTPHWSA